MKAFKFTIKGQPVTIHAINAGTVAMKTRAHSIRHNNFVRRLIDIVRDKDFTDELPVYCWLIEHPEGLFLVDTGYSSQINDPGYLKKAQALERWFSSTQVKAAATKNDEIVSQLTLMGITPQQLNMVILTHLHVDHVGGIPAMKGAKFIVSETELNNNSQAFLLPDWFDPEKVKFIDTRIGSFSTSYPLTTAGDMHLVATPGHTKGHSSVLLQTDEVDILFAGDVVYAADQLLTDTLSAPNDLKSSPKSYKMIRDHGSDRPLIVLPSHDPKSVQSLEHPFDNLVGSWSRDILSNANVFAETQPAVSV